MLPQPKVVKMTEPEVTGVDPVPDDSISQESSNEAYSEGGLSGEADVNAERDEEVS
jgi:hypothetical protein